MKSAKATVDAGICERLVAPAELDNDYSFHVIAGTLDDLLDAFGLRLDTRGDRSTARRRRWSRGAGGCSRFFNVVLQRRTREAENRHGAAYEVPELPAPTPVPGRSEVGTR
jgi:hypothetical protein